MMGSRPEPLPNGSPMLLRDRGDAINLGLAAPGIQESSLISQSMTSAEVGRSQVGTGVLEIGGS